MKHFILITTLLFASVEAYATCINFAGTYEFVGPAPTTTLTVIQNKCTSVEFDYQTGPDGQVLGKVYPLNNVRRQTSANSTVDVYETSGMQGSTLQNLVEFYYLANQKTITSVSQFYFDANHNLFNTENDYDENGKLYHSTVKQFNSTP
jgi:hypothetical protein